MVKTLKVTTLLIAMGALIFIIFISAKGMETDEGIEKFLSAPGVAERLQAGSDGSRASDSDKETPLIREAKKFALRIDPPPPPRPIESQTKTARSEPVRRPPAAVSAKFTLVGTSYHTGDEQNSWALINEIGKGWHWVRQGDRIGHLIVEGIGDGVVLIRDGDNTSQLAAERDKKADYVKSFTGTLDSAKVVPEWQGAQKAVTKVESSEKNGNFNTETGQSTPPMAPEVEKKLLEENIEWLRQLQEDPQSLGMTAEEAKELEGLGEMLQVLETEVKTIDVNESDASGKPVTTTEPNTADDTEPDTAEEINSEEAIDTDEKDASEIDESQLSDRRARPDSNENRASSRRRPPPPRRR